MFGLVTFAELIFADMGSPVFVNSGWDKLPAFDCDRQDWQTINSSCAEAEALDKGEAEWTVIK